MSSLQVVDCKAHLAKTTGLLQFSVEVLREQDAVQFIQVRNIALYECFPILPAICTYLCTDFGAFNIQ